MQTFRYLFYRRSEKTDKENDKTPKIVQRNVFTPFSYFYKAFDFKGVRFFCLPSRDGRLYCGRDTIFRRAEYARTPRGGRQKESLPE